MKYKIGDIVLYKGIKHSIEGDKIKPRKHFLNDIYPLLGFDFVLIPVEIAEGEFMPFVHANEFELERLDPI
ncbi:MAG: hypothetical protein IPK08_03420 [Bacteroidetes bacterium]|nr:hypothetical protein [Bacteroidota bacterium]